jgi:heme o synthase
LSGNIKTGVKQIKLIGLQVRSTVWLDYLSLTKPRTVLLHLVTAAAAMFLAAGGLPSIPILISTLAAGSLVAGASNVLNCYFDRDIDRFMARTRNRPLPSRRISSQKSLAFSFILAFSGVFIFSWFVNWLAAVLAVGALAYYILVYTLWLKRRSFWSSIIGSGAGAFPPLIGWIAVTERIEITPFLLFFIIVFWTPAHFWSLGMARRQDYGLANLEVIPRKNTVVWIIVASVVLVAISICLKVIAGLSILYLSTASTLGLFLVIQSVRLQFTQRPEISNHLFLFSIVYLMVLFGIMIIDLVVSI